MRRFPKMKIPDGTLRWQITYAFLSRGIRNRDFSFRCSFVNRFNDRSLSPFMTSSILIGFSHCPHTPVPSSTSVLKLYHARATQCRGPRPPQLPRHQLQQHSDELYAQNESEIFRTKTI
jgi:hypothetical protein